MQASPVKQVNKPDVSHQVSHEQCMWLAKKYHSNEASVLAAAEQYSPEQFIRLFVTAHGMTPVGTWQTHTYARYTDHNTNEEHFFLIPMPVATNNSRPLIRFEEGLLKIDDIYTNIYPQSIPHTTPFWYFHYDPNHENIPYRTMTLNLSPSCMERCVLCAGAKTGRVNNGMSCTLTASSVLERVFAQHPEARNQLESVAIVTGCFADFNELKLHLTDVKESMKKYCSPKTYRVLERNITTEDQFDQIVGELGYDVFITLECFDQEIRNIALNGKVGRKGRNSEEFITILENYSNYLEARPELENRLIHITYLMGLDSLEVTEQFFKRIAEINKRLTCTTIVPWLSIFTTYNDAMRTIQHPDFGLKFLVDGIAICEKYFSTTLLKNNSGGTSDGFARGLF